MANGTTRDNIITEANRLAVDVLFSEKGHFAAAGRWSKVHLAIGIPSALLAAAAGGAFFAGWTPAVPSLLAFMASALSAIATFLDPNGVAARHHRSGVLYGSMRRLIRQFIHVESRLSTDDTALAKQLRQLTDQVASIQADSLPIPGFARRIAKREIESGSANYTAQELQIAVGEERGTTP